MTLDKPIPMDLEKLVKEYRKDVTRSDVVISKPMPAGQTATHTVERTENGKMESSTKNGDAILIPSKNVQDNIIRLFDDMSPDNVQIIVS